jgi:tetratricopeptide (TPR) repeat protein
VVLAQQSSIKAAQEAYESGSALRTKKDFQGALNAFTKAIQIDPNFSDAWRLRGLVYRDLSQMKEATADIERAIQKPGTLHCFFRNKDWKR